MMTYSTALRYARRFGALTAASAAVFLNAASAASTSGQSPTDSPIEALPAVVVTGTPAERPLFAVPASVDLIDGELARRDQMQVNLSEGLTGVPGVVVQNRHNYAQDLQVSMRGFGSRSTFGVRGVRLYVDGIPATMPDGQGQTSNIDMSSIDRIEVLRGPFSALYGNSAGGVLQIFTEKGDGPPSLQGRFSAGSDGQRHYGIKAGGSQPLRGDDRTPGIDYLISTNRYTTQGYRDHSAARKNLANARLGLALDDDSTLTLVMNHVDVRADDPQGLTRDEFMKEPRKAAPNALRYDTRKTVRQTQGGLTYERAINADNNLHLMAYYGQRSTLQFLGIPPAAQGAPGHAGGVVDLNRRYGGADIRWTTRLRLADRPFTLVAGVGYDTMAEDRRGYENFRGEAQAPTATGVKGQLRRNERNTVWNIDPYVQATWQFAPQWSLDAGLRYSTVRFDSDDLYVAPGNSDDSGSARYRKALPMAALSYQPNDDIMLYATAGRGFETPTFSELSYRPDEADASAGLNFALKPAVSTSLEVGAKARTADGGLLTAALFETRTRDEIVVAQASNGRTSYRNAGRTRRKGVELSWSASPRPHLQAQFAYTWMDARYRDSFTTLQDGEPRRVDAGALIPGIARHALFASLTWAPPAGWQAGVEAKYLSSFYVNDHNDEAVPGYFTAAIHGGYVWTLQHWRLNAFARIDNVFDRHYAGSAIINAGNGRYYEPAPGRTWFAGLQASYQF